MRASIFAVLLSCTLWLPDAGAQRIGQPQGVRTGSATRFTPTVADALPGLRATPGVDSLSPVPTNLRVDLRIAAPVPSRAPWWAPLASALIPGSGQAALGQQRGVAYLVAEGYLLVQYFGAQRDVTQGTRDYQSYAADIARRQFGGRLPVGPWEYYETLEKFDASGRYDMIPGGAIDPETDESTFNGQSWLLARTTYWTSATAAPPASSAEYQRALAFYAQRAWRDEFRWSWNDALVYQDVYKGKIATANRSNQRKTNLVAFVGANHLASLIDAYINVRIRRYGGAGIAGFRLDGVQSHVGYLGPSTGRQHGLQTAFRLVPARPR